MMKLGQGAFLFREATTHKEQKKDCRGGKEAKGKGGKRASPYGAFPNEE